MGREELGNLVCQGMSADTEHPGCPNSFGVYSSICKNTPYRASDKNEYFEKIDTCGTTELLGQFLRARNCWGEQFTWTWWFWEHLSRKLQV